MSEAGCTAGNCLPGSDSPWLLLVLAVVWATVAVLFGLWGITVWRERERPQTSGTQRATRRPRHAPTGRAVRSAVSVHEITQRLDRESAAQARHPPRRVAVIHRVAPLPEAGPDTAPFTPSELPDDDQ
ncbi:MAG: hypothetical protein ACRDTE_17415 [Pseudonocardiaceae bacterium]